MSKDKQHRRSILTKCKHCGSIVTFDWERTTADEYNASTAPLHKITEALKRLRDKYGYGVPEGEKNGKKRQSKQSKR